MRGPGHDVPGFPHITTPFGRDKIAAEIIGCYRYTIRYTLFPSK